MSVGTVLRPCEVHLGLIEIPAAAVVEKQQMGMPEEERRTTVLQRLEGLQARD
jgi:hypothetical protein